MNDVPRQKLCEIVREHGTAVCRHGRRFKALLRRACPGHPREVHVLLAARDVGVPTDLLELPAPTAWPAAGAPLVYRLREEMSMTEEAARWGVDSWALALGKITTDQAVPSTPAAVERELGGPVAGGVGLTE